jgi:hypothetical protein
LFHSFTLGYHIDTTRQKQHVITFLSGSSVGSFNTHDKRLANLNRIFLEMEYVFLTHNHQAFSRMAGQWDENALNKSEWLGPRVELQKSQVINA